MTTSVPQSVRVLVPAYLKSVSEQLSRLRGAVQAADFDTAARIGHNLGGTGAGYGFEEITDAGQRIEKAALERRATDVIDATEELRHRVAVHERAGFVTANEQGHRQIDIVIADDDENFRRYARAVLEEAGLCVDEAADGREAIVKLLEHPGAMLLIDLVMPEMEGLETIRTLRGRQLKNAIIAISGVGNRHGYLDVAARLGATAILQKPVRADVLSRTVKRLSYGSGGGKETIA